MAPLKKKHTSYQLKSNQVDAIFEQASKINCIPDWRNRVWNRAFEVIIEYNKILTQKSTI